MNLAKNDHDIDPVAERNLFMRGLSEDVRLRLENFVASKTGRRGHGDTADRLYKDIFQTEV